MDSAWEQKKLEAMRMRNAWREAAVPSVCAYHPGARAGRYFGLFFCHMEKSCPKLF
jgi:hypothetical protein